MFSLCDFLVEIYRQYSAGVSQISAFQNIEGRWFMIIKNIMSLTGLQILWSSWTSENPSRVWGILQGASGPAHSVKELLRNAAYIAHGTGSMDKAPEGNRIRSALCALLIGAPDSKYEN